MADDLPTAETNLTAALVRNSKRAIKRYSQGQRVVEFESLKDVAEAIEKTRALNTQQAYCAQNGAEVTD